MWNEPAQERLARIPRLYETEGVPVEDKLVHLHFFIGGCDWWIVEYDGRDIFFGYAVLNGDYLNAEWGYVSFSELKAVKAGFLEVDCETVDAWRVRPAREVEGIRLSADR